MTAIQGRILVVDDNEANRVLLVRQLERQGHVAETASNGRDALEMITANNYDLVLLDIMMPEMDGYQVLEQLGQDEELRKLPVVMISALNEIESVVRCIELGADDYLFKPIDRVLLRARVYACLEKKFLRDVELNHLKEINRLKDEFVRMASHDLKNPINVLMGYVHLLDQTGMTEGHEHGEQILTGLQSTVQRIRTLVEDLLDLSKMEAGASLDFQSVPLADFLAGCLEGFDLLAQQKNISLDFSPPPPDMNLSLDITRFGQVINNLLSNAVKYTPEGGQVSLETQIAPDAVLIQVNDTGLGIPEDDLPRLFEKFYRVNREEHLASEGTGLGLAIVKATVEQHGGTIWVESELGKGSSFNIQLPVNG
jgi:signal transduction histidine kinase